MSGISKAQKEKLVNEFRSLTSAIPADASRICKKANYRLELAFDLFYSDPLAQSNAERSIQSRSKALTEGVENLLNTQFDRFKDSDDSARMEMEGLLEYLDLLSLTPEDPKVLCLCHLLNAPRLGLLLRTEFVKSWISMFLGMQPTRSIQSSNELVEFQTLAITNLERRLKSDLDYFQRVYRFVFDFGKDEGQKSLALETGIAFWEMLIPLTPDLQPSVFKPEYLQWWFELLRSRHKSITRDTWNLFLDFIVQSNDRFENYDEFAAWPSLIDDYVAVAKQKLEANQMDVS